MTHSAKPAVWFPAIRAGTGTDVFTRRLRDGLDARGIRAEITWLPHRAEYLPWTVSVPFPPAWANVVHVNTWLHRRFVPPRLLVVATMHHSVHNPILSPSKSWSQAQYHRAWVRPLENWILHRANAVTAISHHTARMTQDIFGVGEIYVIYNGMPALGKFDLMKREPHKPFRLLYVGNFSKLKGCDLFVPIMEKLGADFSLSYTAKSNIKFRLPSNCKCIGWLDRQQLEEVYCDMDALLFPTRQEGFGYAALEAMAYGLPVIATNGSALPEVVEDGVTGILCPMDDHAAFASAALRLRDDQDSWSAMSKAAIKRARSRMFSVESMVDSYVNVYEALLTQDPHT